MHIRNTHTEGEVIELGVIQSPTPLELFLGKLLWFLTANLFVMPPAFYQYQCSLSPAVQIFQIIYSKHKHA